MALVGHTPHPLAEPLWILRCPAMGVHVRLFAGLRERAGWSKREIEAQTVADVWPALGPCEEPEGVLYAGHRRALGLGREPDGPLPAINRDDAKVERELVDGD